MPSSAYLEHLPAILREPAPGRAESFLGEFLKIFEALLSGRDDASVRGLEEIIAAFHEVLDPALAPVDDGSTESSAFLRHLASWVGLDLDRNWPLEQQRAWLERAVRLYRRRGTRETLDEYLKVFVGPSARVEEPSGGLTIAETSTVGVDTFIAGVPAYFFRVHLDYAPLLPWSNPQVPEPEPETGQPFDLDVWRQRHRGTRAVVDLEKPSHTWYEVEARTAGFVVGVRATVAKTTLLWETSLVD